MPLKCVIDYLKHDMLNILSEADIFEGIKFWVTNDLSHTEERIKMLPELITCLRASNISKKGVKDIYEDRIMVKCPVAQEKLMQKVQVEVRMVNLSYCTKNLMQNLSQTLISLCLPYDIV